MITAAPLTIARRNAAVAASAYVHTTDPGVIAVTYPTGITGPPTVTAAGSRAPGNMGSGGDYVARAGAEGNDRSDVTFFIKVDWSKIQSSTMAGVQFSTGALIASLRTDAARRANWMIGFQKYNIGTTALAYVQSANSTTNEAAIYATADASTADAVRKYAVVLASGAAGDVGVTFYRAARARANTVNRATTSGTMGGTEALVWHSGVQCAKVAHKATNDELDAWFATDTIPATDREFMFMGGHEINPAAPVVYDTSGNAYDLSAVNIAGWPASALPHPDYTDTGFTSPIVEVPITIAADCAAGTHNITLRRTRVGIPTRVPALSDAALYDDGVLPITVAVTAESVTIGPDVACQVPSYPATFDLQLCGNYDGAATVVSDDANLVPASPVTITGGVAVVECTVTADVTGATVTATGPGGDTDSCTVTVSEVPEPEELLAIGPDTDTEVESYPDAIILLLTSNVDGDVEIVSDDANLIPMSPVTIIDGKAEVTCLVTADVTGATITASRDPSPSDSCSVSVSEIIPDHWLTAGPDHSARARGERVMWPIRVESNHDGEFTVVSDPAEGLTIHGPLVIADGVCDFYAQPLAAGSWSVLVTQESASAPLSLELLSAEPARVPTQYDLCSVIDDFMKFVTRKYGLKPKFIPMEVADVRSEQSTDRSYSRYAQGTPGAGVVHSAVQLLYQVMISYSSTALAQQDLGMLREEMDRYSWPAIGFTGSISTMFEPKSMTPRLTIDLQFDIMAQGR